MIRRVTAPELPLLAEAAAEFYASSRFLRGFEIERFCETWQLLLGNDSGVIFADFLPNGTIAGTVGGFSHRDLYGESIIAEELFWYVHKDHRGRGVLLYRELEKWAVGKGAASLQMVHLLDSMPEKLQRFYHLEGFEAIETRYSKDLNEHHGHG